MKLIFIYGPPASGKLTIAEKLSELTGIPLFHNHLSRDIVKDIYNEALTDNYELVDKIRFDVLEYCAKHGTDLIFTYVYAGTEDDNNVNKYIHSITRSGGEVNFVELTATRKDLIDRVDDESRKRFKKLTDPEIMSKITQSMENFTIPFVDALTINTSVTGPHEAVELIVKNLDLA